jgi:hypothetical protein
LHTNGAPNMGQVVPFQVPIEVLKQLVVGTAMGYCL